MTASGKSGDAKSGDSKRAERLAAALRDNLKRRKAQIKVRAKARSQAAANAAEPDFGGITPEIAQAKPKG